MNAALEDNAASVTTTADLPPGFDADATSRPSGPQAERNEKKAQRRLDALTWVPEGDSTAVRHEPLELGHKTVQRNFGLWYVQIQIVMHKLQNFLPREIGEAKAAELLDIVDARIAAVEKAVDDEIGRLKVVARENDIELGEKSFSSPESKVVPIYTPFARRMLRVIRRIDELYWMAESLWIEGAIKDSHKWNMINFHRKALWTFVKETTTLWVRARNSLRADKKTRREVEADRESARPTKVAA